MHDNSKPLLGFFVAISFISCVFAFLGQSTRPMLADDAIVSRAISHSPMNAISSPSGSIARTKRITQVVILWVATARKIPNAVQGSVGRVGRTPIAIIRDTGRRFPPAWSVEELDTDFVSCEHHGNCRLMVD